jgi:hypothetical protein
VLGARRKNPSENMSKADEKAAREQRLATKLRENLKRRKGQARARAGSAPKSPAVAPDGKAS